jgi:hypothetical protein
VDDVESLAPPNVVSVGDAAESLGPARTITSRATCGPNICPRTAAMVRHGWLDAPCV